MKGVIVGRHINGITINPSEYLLQDDGRLMVFAEKEVAKQFLYDNGFTNEDIEYLVFEEYKE